EGGQRLAKPPPLSDRRSPGNLAADGFVLFPRYHQSWEDEATVGNGRRGADQARNSSLTSPGHHSDAVPDAGNRRLEKMTAVKILFLHILPGSVSRERESSSSW